ncbi:MAG: hypothetical protein GY812_06460 [Actinomycetia bacterium]|nr:hypothetical protein [Actinomycetes bacterium]
MRTRRTLSTILIALAGAVAITSCAGAPPFPDKFAHVVSDDGLARLRGCESGGNYNALNPSGKYRGAYQFSRTTWNSVARTHYPHLNGVDPAEAWPWEQDAMARALWHMAGRGQWPHCGKKV